MAGNQANITNLQVEHLMPGGWNETDWPLPDSEDREASRQEREVVIQTLGNLTLLNRRLNLAVSNSAWAVKRQKIEESDNLFLNRILLNDSADYWTEDHIRSRGEWMYDQLKEIWPRG